MRERIARAVSALTVGGLVLLAVAFARAQNPPAAGTQNGVLAVAPSSPPAQVVDSARGRALFEQHACAGCHSAAGLGSPRLPLDGVGARRSPAELLAWTSGAEALADSLAPSVFRRKQAYGQLPTADLNALVAFLASLKTPRGP